MKLTFVTLSFLLLTFFTKAQNPYFDLSYPWLYQGYAKEKKIKSIVLGTMDSDGQTQLRQLVLYFDEEGNPISEESRIGFLFSMTLQKLKNDTSLWVFKDDLAIDSLYFIVNRNSKEVVKYVVSLGNGSAEGRTVFRSIYKYDELGRILSITDSEKMPYHSENFANLEFINQQPFSYQYDGNKVSFKSGESLVEMLYDDKGRIQLWKSHNNGYGIHEEISYSWDYQGLLLMMEWTQEGNTEKTFVSYNYYE